MIPHGQCITYYPVPLKISEKHNKRYSVNKLRNVYAPVLKLLPTDSRQSAFLWLLLNPGGRRCIRRYKRHWSDHSHSAFVEWTSPVLRFTDFLLVAYSAKIKIKYLDAKYWSLSSQDGLKSKNTSSSHHQTAYYIPQCSNFNTLEGDELIHTPPSLSSLQNLCYKFGVSRRKQLFVSSSSILFSIIHIHILF